MSLSFPSIGIIGAGAWGTALAVALDRAGKRVTLWARRAEHAQEIAQKRENKRYLPKIQIPTTVTVTAEGAALTACDALILAVPAQYVRSVCQALAPSLPERSPVLIAAKGVEQTTHRLMSEVVTAALPTHPIFILTGPSFATEVARNLPTALTLGGETDGMALAHALSSPTLRLYTTDDIIGAQIGGAVKNVLAIACGIVMGRGLGENARAALITRGLAEIARLGLALGARTETLMGLSGLGDAVLTCSSPQSRNTSFGIAVGKGEKIETILATRPSVTEGVSTAAATLGLAHRHGVDMPVTRAVDLIVREGADIDQVIADLLARPLRPEDF